MHKVISLENENTEKEVLGVFAKELDFPDYFGHNIPAFWEVMTDLGWIAEGELDIDIYGLPSLVEHVGPNYVILLTSLLGEICRYWDQLSIEKDPIYKKEHKITFRIFFNAGGSTKIGGNIWGDLGAGWSGPEIWKDDLKT